MLVLENDRLRVLLAEPGETPNTFCRFDRAGYVTEVTLDGSRTFCAGEPKNLFHPYTGGRGLCCEYTADYSGEVKDGAYFPKLGVGLLRRDGPYIFYGRYERRPFQMEIAREKGDEGEALLFTTLPEPCLGIALRTEKRIAVSGNRLTMTVTAENVGERRIVTGEYCHNFLSIDGMAMSPDYSLSLPIKKGFVQEHCKEEGLPAGGGMYPLENAYENPCNFALTPEGVAVLRAETAVSLTDIPGEALEPGKVFEWSLSHRGARAEVIGRDAIAFRQLKLWGTDHMISPEIIQEIDLRPGEWVSWIRSWTFEGEPV